LHDLLGVVGIIPEGGFTGLFLEFYDAFSLATEVKDDLEG